MEDTIKINLRALSEDARNEIERILDEELNDTQDEENEIALDILRNFNEE